MAMMLDSYDENESKMRSHIRLVHGVYVEPRLTLAELIECHNQAHADGLVGKDGWTNLLVKHSHRSQMTLGANLETWEW